MNDKIVDGKDFFYLLRNHIQESINPYLNTEPFLHLCDKAARFLPVDVQLKIINFARKGNKEGYLLIKNLELDPVLPMTPSNKGEIPDKKTFYSESWLAIFGNLLGDPFSFIQEGEGRLFHNIRPVKENENELSSQSSALILDLHTEVAFSVFIMDFVLLFCLRDDRTCMAKTFLSSIREVIEELPFEIIQELFTKNFKTWSDPSFCTKHPDREFIVSVLSGDKTDPLMIYDQAYFTGLTDSASHALQIFEKAVSKHMKGILLEPSDLLIIDNRRVVHGRNKFKAFYDGKDRWLQRLFVSRDLARAEAIFSKKDRIIDYDF